MMSGFQVRARENVLRISIRSRRIFCQSGPASSFLYQKSQRRMRRTSILVSKCSGIGAPIWYVAMVTSTPRFSSANASSKMRICVPRSEKNGVGATTRIFIENKLQVIARDRERSALRYFSGNNFFNDDVLDSIFDKTVERAGPEFRLQAFLDDS